MRVASQCWRAACLARGGGPVVGCCSAAPQLLLQFFVLVVTALRDLVADRGFKVIWGIFLDCDLGIFFGKVVFC